MESITQQSVLFVGCVVVAAAVLAFGLRAYRNSRGWPSIDVPDEMSLDEAAKFAQQRIAAEDLPLGRVIARGNSEEGVFAWFVASIRKRLPAGAITVTRQQLRRYLKWARAVQ